MDHNQANVSVAALICATVLASEDFLLVTVGAGPAEGD
jgi:hypothetical protein